MNEQLEQLLFSNQAVIEALAQVIGQQKQITHILKDLENEKGIDKKNTQLIYDALSKQAISLSPSKELKEMRRLLQENIMAINREEKMLKSNSNLKFLIWGWGLLGVFLMGCLLLMKYG